MLQELKELLAGIETQLRKNTRPPYTKGKGLGPKEQAELEKARSYLKNMTPSDKINFEDFLLMVHDRPWSHLVPDEDHFVLPMAVELYHEEQVQLENLLAMLETRTA